MKTKLLFDKIILGNNKDKSEIIIPWKNILVEKELEDSNNSIYRSIIISCWLYMVPLETENGDKTNINRIFSQLQNNGLECGIFLGSKSFDKRLYSGYNSSKENTTIESTYYSNKSQLNYYNWEFLLFKLNFNDSGTKLISNEIYLNCKIYNQTNLTTQNSNSESNINISKYPLIIGGKDLSHEILLSELTIHFNTRHDILPIFQSNSIIQPIYPPNTQNKSLLGQNFNITVKPLNSLVELLNWKNNKNNNNNNNEIITTITNNNNNNNYNNNNINISTIKLNKRSNINNITTKRIHCNDIMNGYQLDKYSQGNYEIKEKKELWYGQGYNFYYWNLIDIFIYFTHHTISIPPVGWINSAHKNGVKILGTIIFEWEQSLPDAYLLVDGIPENINIFIDKLIEISTYFKFDGWFLNLETCLLDDPTYVEKYQLFLKNLTNSIHNHDKGSLIIWYDSVTENGELNWQNSLNEKNIKFFNNCDGIFLNYCWNKELLKVSNSISLNRNKDVYVGTDVWGRGTFGGGGFNTWLGLKEADLNQLSSAIFAPGWTFENSPSKKMSIQRERSLWLGNIVENLVENGSAEKGDFSTWSPIHNNNNNSNDRYKWIIDDKSFKYIKSSRFDSKSFMSFKKRLDLIGDYGYSKEVLDKLPIIEFEFYFKSSNNQNDSNNYPVNLVMLDENQSILKEFNTHCLSIKKINWKKYKLSIKDYPIGIRFIDIIIIGNNNCEISITGINLQIIAISKNIGLNEGINNNNNNNNNSIRSVTDERISISSLPFSSSFNRGKGKKYWKNGRVLSNNYWFNLSDQDIIGCEEDYRYQLGSKFIISTTSYGLSYNGGSCLNIKGKLETISKVGNNQFIQSSSYNNKDCNNKYSISTLFKTDIKIEEEQQLLITYTWSLKSFSNIEEISRLCLILVFSDENNTSFKNVILHPSTLGGVSSSDNNQQQQQLFPFNINNNIISTNNQNEFIIYESDQDEIINGDFDWYQSKFCLNISDFIFFNNNNNNDKHNNNNNDSNGIKLKEIKSFSYNFKYSENNEEVEEGKLELYNVFIGEITLDTVSNRNSNNIEIKSCKIDKIWNMDSLTSEETCSNSNTNLELYDIILNWEYNENQDSLIKCTNIYLDKKWVGRSYNNNFYIIKSKLITLSSFVTLELVNHLNAIILSNDFKLFE